VNERLTAALADRYRLERELGAGGMATVYLARDLKHDRQVAVKVLRPELGAVLGAERFLAEIRITARLDHPHILTLIDSGEAGGLLYYVLPFIRGESLRDKLARNQQLGIDEALSITRQIAGALDHAHRQGVIHRDIKPENILLHEGEAMLADFGIALAVKEAGGTGGGTGGGNSGGAPPLTVAVTVGNNLFKSGHNGSTGPAVDTVAAGGTVTWMDLDQFRQRRP
jgi:serine/threonine protein kinase